VHRPEKLADLYLHLRDLRAPIGVEITPPYRLERGLEAGWLRYAAFDKGLVSFADDGTPLASPKLSDLARRTLGVDTAPKLNGLRDAHRANLLQHRKRYGY
jgi:hypothetical protein